MFSIKFYVGGKETKNFADDLISSIKKNILTQTQHKFDKIGTDLFDNSTIDKDVEIQFNIEFSEDMKFIKIETNSLKDKSVVDALIVSLKNNLSNNYEWLNGIIQIMIDDLEDKLNRLDK